MLELRDQAQNQSTFLMCPDDESKTMWELELGDWISYSIEAAMRARKYEEERLALELMEKEARDREQREREQREREQREREQKEREREQREREQREREQREKEGSTLALSSGGNSPPHKAMPSMSSSPSTSMPVVPIARTPVGPPPGMKRPDSKPSAPPTEPVIPRRASDHTQRSSPPPSSLSSPAHSTNAIPQVSSLSFCPPSLTLSSRFMCQCVRQCRVIRHHLVVPISCLTLTRTICMPLPLLLCVSLPRLPLPLLLLALLLVLPTLYLTTLLNLFLAMAIRPSFPSPAFPLPALLCLLTN